MEIWFVIWGALITVLAHELGHWLGFQIFGINPKVKFTWWGIQVGNERDVFSLSPRQYFVVILAGVLIGLVEFYLWFGNDYYLLAVYLVVCSVDFGQMIGLQTLDKYDKFSMLKACKKQLKVVEIQLKGKKICEYCGGDGVLVMEEMGCDECKGTGQVQAK